MEMDEVEESRPIGLLLSLRSVSRSLGKHELVKQYEEELKERGWNAD